MSRVSESSSIHAIQHAVSKTKQRLEDLQIKGSNLRRVQKPSDDPVGNVDILSIRSKKVDANQYERNASVAKAQLTYTENAISELTELMMKVKDIAIAQSSNLFDVNVRKSAAKEIQQLRNQAISIANRRLGNKYIFAGHKSLTKPFNEKGEYLGDKNQTKVEISKDFYVPISFNGKDIFFERDGVAMSSGNPRANTPLDNIHSKMKFDKDKVQIDENLNEPAPMNNQQEDDFYQLNRTPAGDQSDPKQTNINEADPLQRPEPAQIKEARTSIFSDIQRLYNAMTTDNHEIIQDILPVLDKGIDRLIETRTKIGSLINSIDTSVDTLQKDQLINEEFKSKIEDADIGELFTDLTRQKNVLNATYKASAQLMNKNLMDYIR